MINSVRRVESKIESNSFKKSTITRIIKFLKEIILKQFFKEIRDAEV